jgi:ComF family protein
VAGAITQAFECGHCRVGEHQFAFARSAVLAHGHALELIHRYKYQRALWFEPLLARFLIAKAEPELTKGNWDMIVPVPLHPTKEREREFNQAERLGARLSAACGIPINARLLRRVVATKTQTMLRREERLENVRGAFAPRGDQSLHGERVVLVDDVFTTGATTDSCARVLRGMGAGAVCVWTVARGI